MEKGAPKTKVVRLESDADVVVVGRDFRVAVAEDTANRQLILHLYTTAEEIEPRPLTKFLKLGKSDINGQVVIIRAKGRVPDAEYRSVGGLELVD